MSVDSASDFGDRVWAAYLALPRDKHGRPPAQTVVEKKHGLSRGLLGKIASGKQREVQGKVLDRLARALQTTPDFLTSCRGPWPRPSGPLIPRPRLFDAGKRPIVIETIGTAVAEVGSAEAGSDLPSALAKTRSRAAEVLIRQHNVDIDDAMQAVAGVTGWPWGELGPTPERWALVALAALNADRAYKAERHDRPVALAVNAGESGHGVPKALPAAREKRERRRRQKGIERE